MNEKEKPEGRTVQIDFRDKDFAKAIAYYYFHVSKHLGHSTTVHGEDGPFIWILFQSTILKGYSKHYKSFDHLHEAIKANYENSYGLNSFDTLDLNFCPPLVMVFLPGDVVTLADETIPLSKSQSRRGYAHIHYTFKNQVLSFVEVGKARSNFILEIVHSGLGLHYNRSTNEARNPLNGKLLEKEKVIFDSLVDRVMIDVSLELRLLYPKLLFSSCTRLPDVITPVGQYKASYQTSRLVPWEDSEEGLSSRLRAMHGGLYPQSHLVVADNPAAEIAARTWIDQDSGLNRSDLLRLTYEQWLGKAQHLKTAMDTLNDEFLPNKTLESIPAYDTPGTPDSPVDGVRKTRFWLSTLEEPDEGLLHTPGSADGALQLWGPPINTAEEHSSSDDAADRPEGTDDARSQSGELSGQDVRFTVAGKDFVFTKRKGEFVAVTSAVYYAAAAGDMNALQKLISDGAQVDIPTGFWGTPLAAACALNQLESALFLLGEGASVHKGGEFGFPLEVASEQGHVRIVEILLMAMKERANHEGLQSRQTLFTGTALHRASRRVRENVVRMLLDERIDVHLREPTTNNTALHAACDSSVQNLSIIQMLIHSGVQVNAQGSSGSVLKLECRKDNYERAKLFLAKGAVVDFLPLQGLSPRIIRLLESAGTNIEDTWTQSASEEAARHARVLAKTPQERSQVEDMRLRQRIQLQQIETYEANRLAKPPARFVRVRAVHTGPKLQSCGCFICFVDQGTQPRDRKYLAGSESSHDSDPIYETLSQPKRH